MACSSCLAEIDDAKVAMFTDILELAGAPAMRNVRHADVVQIGKLPPDLLICDIDKLIVDPLEMLRRLRFVLPAASSSCTAGR